MPNQFTPPRPAIYPIGPSIAYLDLGNDRYALVDSWNAPFLESMRWHIHPFTGHTDYVATKRVQKRTLLHHSVVGFPEKPLVVDHINRNGMDNRSSNLRFCTHAQNMHNTSIRKDNKSGVKGVRFRADKGYWVAEMRVNNKKHSLGYFKTLEEAVEARRSAEVRLTVI